MTRIRTVVVDDEDSNRHFIKGMIRELNPHFDIQGEADSVKSAYRIIKQVQPDVVFLDIKMPDGSGFELLNMFEEINFEVVFISSFDSYALKAFEFNALDYILKPIEPEKFAKNLSKVQRKLERKIFEPEDLKTIVQSYDLKQLIISKIPVHNGNNVILLDIENIISIQSGEGCTLFRIASGEKYSSAKQLSDFDFILDNHPCMVKINKSTYINLNQVSSYSKGITCSLTMKDDAVIDISRRKKSEILALLAGKKPED